MKLLKYENGKLHHQLIFSLPAGHDVCGMECKGCYALKFQRLYPNVLPYRNRVLEASKQPDFVERIVSEIQSCRKPLVAVRIHESGEFYSQSYVNRWTSIAMLCPSVKFYAFTKRLRDFDFSVLRSLPNVVIMDSLQYNSLNYGPLAKLDQSKFICPATLSKSSKCGIDCSYCWSKQAQSHVPLFVKH